MAEEHWTYVPQNGNIVDGEGFIVVSLSHVVVLANWGKTGALHWSDRPGETFRDLTDEQVAARARLIVGARGLRAALTRLLAQLPQPNLDNVELDAAIDAARTELERVDGDQAPVASAQQTYINQVTLSGGATECLLDLKERWGWTGDLDSLASAVISFAYSEMKDAPRSA